MKSQIILIALVVFLSLPFVAFSLPVTYHFSGTINRVLEDRNVLNGEVEIGTSFSGQFTYEYIEGLDENITFMDDPTVAIYPAISNASLKINEHLVAGDNPFSKDSLQIWDNRDSGWPNMDAFSVSSGLDYTPSFDLGLGQTLTSSFTISFWDTTGLLFSSDVLPSPSLIDLQNFDKTYLGLSGLNHDEYHAYKNGEINDYSSFYVAGEITSLTVSPVPEPSTFLLLGGGLAGLVFYSHRRRKE